MSLNMDYTRLTMVQVSDRNSSAQGYQTMGVERNLFAPRRYSDAEATSACSATYRTLTPTIDRRVPPQP